MKIDNVEVYGLAESIVASGLPMKEDFHEAIFKGETRSVNGAVVNKVTRANLYPEDGANAHLMRIKKLASCKGGESHDCALCGIVVQMNVTAPRYWFPEAMRYHWFEIVSSTSTMHKLKAVVRQYDKADDIERLDIISRHFSPLTALCIAEAFMEFALDNLDSIEEIKANLPEGWLQTARITTNYRQLKTIKRQRKDHRLNEWKEFCAWIGTLPMAEELITGEQ